MNTNTTYRTLEFDSVFDLPDYSTKKTIRLFVAFGVDIDLEEKGYKLDWLKVKETTMDSDLESFISKYSPEMMTAIEKEIDDRVQKIMEELCV